MVNLNYEIHHFRQVVNRVTDPNAKKIAEFAMKLAEHLQDVEEKADKAYEEARRHG